MLTRSATGINVSHVRKKETGTKPVQTGKESEMTTLTYSAELELANNGITHTTAIIDTYGDTTAEVIKDMLDFFNSPDYEGSLQDFEVVTQEIDEDFEEIVIQGTIAETDEDTNEETEYIATVTIIGR
ncbi:hypothetical protein HMPREF0308_2092 [Corynebacterium striatum ATCC 6940]|nr:hypothetical protein HMPREF0308_2092 [Corynebacterium striatum ATCC 6940]